MMLLSIKHSYNKLLAKGKGGRILVLCYNKALRNYLEVTFNDIIQSIIVFAQDSIKMMIDSDAPTPKSMMRKPVTGKSEKPRKSVEYHVFTIDGMKVHLENKMRGKMEARAKHTGKPTETMDDFDAVFEQYNCKTLQKTLQKNFGYNAIYIDEAQDVKSTEKKWIERLWSPNKTEKKFWVFGDSDQNLSEFRGVFKDSSLLSDVDPDNIQRLSQVLRSTEDIFNCYHQVWYEKKPLSELSLDTSQDSGFESFVMETNDAENNCDDEKIAAEGNTSESGEEMETNDVEINCDDLKSDTSEEESEESEEESDEVGDQEEHCEKCRLITSRIVGQETEQEDIGLNILCSTLGERLVKLVEDEKIAVEDLAILCVDHTTVKYLKEGLKDCLTGHNNKTIQKNNLQFVEAADFATRCSKIKKKGRKSKQSVQKKYLMIDTVSKFKGLEAEVGNCKNISTFTTQVLFRLSS